MTIKVSTNPLSGGKVRRIFALNLNPPDQPMALFILEQTQSMVLDQSPRHLPMGLGTVEVIPSCQPQHG